MKSTVTIAIASYNNALQIERCIESVINQTHKELDILVVDDGSNDNTIKIIDKYKEDQRVRIITKQNGGLSSVRQMGLEEAKGTYICFIDADDYLSENYVENLLRIIERDNSDICVCGSQFEDEKGNQLSLETNVFACFDSDRPLKITNESYLVISPRDVSNLHLSDSWNKIYKISFLKESKVGFSMPKGRNGSDSLFNQLLFLHSPAYSTISLKGYHHVIYEKSAVHRKNKDLLTSFQIIIKKLIEESKRLDLLSTQKQYISKLYYIYLYESFRDVDLEFHTLKSKIRTFGILAKQHQDFMNTFHSCLDNCRLDCGYTVYFFSLVQRSSFRLVPLYFNLIKVISKVHN